jgi:hypothetical protein
VNGAKKKCRTGVGSVHFTAKELLFKKCVLPDEATVVTRKHSPVTHFHLNFTNVLFQLMGIDVNDMLTYKTITEKTAKQQP